MELTNYTTMILFGKISQPSVQQRAVLYRLGVFNNRSRFHAIGE